MIEKATIIAFIVFGLHWIMYIPGMILHFVADWSARMKLPQWIEKPLFSCPICSTPWYGTVIYWLIWGNTLKEWLVVIFCAMGINSVIVFLKSK